MTALHPHPIAIAFLFLSCLSSIGLAQPGPSPPRAAVTHRIGDGIAVASVSVSSDRSTVATPITLRIEVDVPRTASVFPPTLDDATIDETLGRFSVTDRSVSLEPSADADLLRRVYEYTIETLASGTYTIPPLAIPYQLPGMSSGPKTLTTKPVEITIDSLLDPVADPTQFRGLKGPAVEVPRSKPRDQVASAWLAALIAASLLGCFIAWRRRIRPISPQDWAINEINRIEREHREYEHSLGERSDEATDQMNESERSLSQLSATIRRFIEYGQRETATAMSSQELIQTVEQADWPAGAIATLRQFSEQIDRRKFAADLTGDSVDRWCNQLREMIRSVAAGHAANPSGSAGRR